MLVPPPPGDGEDWAHQVWGDALWAAGRAAEEDRVPHPPTGDLPRCRQCHSALGTGAHSPAEGRHWGTECPAEGRHWPALGARRSAGLPAEGRRWLGRRPGTAARAVCARRSEQCAVYGAWLSSMRTLYILLLVYMNI